MKMIFKLAAAVGAVAIPLALAAPRASAGPHLPPAAVQYTGNWAGYGDTGGSYHNVQAVWQVPAIPATSSPAYAYFWVGMGGTLNLSTILNNGLVQIGIIEKSSNGQTYYYAFWEVIPLKGSSTSSQPHIFMGSNGQPLSVKPGDFIDASVSLTGSRYRLKMSDGRGTNNTIWTTPTVVVPGSDAPNNSAEVVMEEPDGTTLADFGQVSFDGVSIDGNPIGSTNPDEMDFWPYPFSPVYVSPIGVTGDNFTITGPAEPVPSITSVGTYTNGVFVYFDIHYADPGNDAEGFGFVGVNGSGWAEENHPFSSPSYGIVGPGSIAYPFNEGCGTAQQSSSYVQAWIYDTAGERSAPVVIHLVCAG
jgi:Peptidase A4 family